MDDHMLSLASTLLRYEVSCLPLNYLGLPLRNNKLSTLDWHSIIHRIQNRLALWQKFLLNFAGGVVLLKFALASILVYFMSWFAMPCSIRRKTKSLMRLFLWSGKTRVDSCLGRIFANLGKWMV